MTPLAWFLLAVAAIVVGISKTSISGLGAVAVALFALVLPAKESTAAVLLLLITGDIVAVALYRRQADWAQLRRLLPAVVPGIVLGAVFLGLVSDRVLLVSIGLLVLAAVALQIGLQAHQAPRPVASGPLPPPLEPPMQAPEPGDSSGREAEAPGEPPAAHVVPENPRRSRPWAAWAAGLAAGFTTMVANSGGAVMALYLLAIKADKARFVATGAWFFLIVNVSKVPFSAGLGLIRADTLRLLLLLIPVVLVGTWVGSRFLRSLSQRAFEWLTILASAASGVTLIVKGLV
jgi:uncharacterized membrane protein YfcA